MEFSSVEEVQDYILTDAEDEANRALAQESGDAQSPLYGMIEPGRAFRADPIQSEKGGLCLTIEESITKTMGLDQIKRMHQIGLESIHKAIIKNQDQFVGLIIAEAREGNNYFDRFGIKQQTRLF